jgi:hypothetical protein
LSIPVTSPGRKACQPQSAATRGSERGARTAAPSASTPTSSASDCVTRAQPGVLGHHEHRVSQRAEAAHASRQHVQRVVLGKCEVAGRRDDEGVAGDVARGLPQHWNFRSSSVTPRCLSTASVDAS